MASSTLDQHNTADLPSSKTAWAEPTLQGLSLFDKGSEYEHERVREAANHHAELMVSLVDIDIDLSLVSFQPTYALKEKHGVHHRKGEESLVTLSLHSLETNGWVKLLATVRHELVHVWQHQHDEWNEGSNHWERSHGDAFRQWCDELCVSTRGGFIDAPATYLISCPDCDKEWEYHRKCKTTKNAREGSLYCTNCDKEATKGRMELYEEGVRQLTSEMDNDECEMLEMLYGIDDELARELETEYNVEGVGDVIASLCEDYTFRPNRGSIKEMTTERPFLLRAMLDEDVTKRLASILELGIETNEHGEVVYTRPE